jgi:hypothetical protein
VTVAVTYARQSNQGVLSPMRQIENRGQGHGSSGGIDIGRARFVAPPRGARANGCPPIVRLKGTRKTGR